MTNEVTFTYATCKICSFSLTVAFGFLLHDMGPIAMTSSLVRFDYFVSHTILLTHLCICKHFWPSLCKIRFRVIHV